MEVVNVKVAYIRPKYHNLREWMADPDNVYIGRARIVCIDGEWVPNRAPWGNPYKTGNNILERYKEYIVGKINNNEVDLETLRGKRLGCFCKLPNKNVPCHGDVLMELLNTFN